MLVEVLRRRRASELVTELDTLKEDIVAGEVVVESSASPEGS